MGMWLSYCPVHVVVRIPVREISTEAGGASIRGEMELIELPLPRSVTGQQHWFPAHVTKDPSPRP